MISTKHISNEMLQTRLIRQKIHIAYPLDIILEEIEKIRDNLPSYFDNLARILALSKPLVEVAMLESGWLPLKSNIGSRGRPALSEVSLMQIQLIAHMKEIGSYRHVERILNSNRGWLNALGLTHAPSHTTLSKFRSNMGEEFFGTFFHKIVAMLYAFNLINDDQVVVIDSAPIEANQNFARSNAGQKLNEKRLEDFFNSIDLSPAIKCIKPHSGKGRKPKFSNKQLFKFLIFDKICGFLSRSAALRHLKKHAAVAMILGFSPNNVPLASHINSFLKHIPPFRWLMRPLVDSITDYFDEQIEFHEDDPLNFFFWSF